MKVFRNRNFIMFVLFSFIIANAVPAKVNAKIIQTDKVILVSSNGWHVSDWGSYETSHWNGGESEMEELYWSYLYDYTLTVVIVHVNCGSYYDILIDRLIYEGHVYQELSSREYLGRLGLSTSMFKGIRFMTPTPTPTATNTPTPTPTNTPKPTATNTPKPTATNTPKPTATNTPKPTATNTPKPTATNTPKPTATNTPKPTATNTPKPTATNTPKPTATNTPVLTATSTPKPTATSTPIPALTDIPIPSPTVIPEPTAPPGQAVDFSSLPTYEQMTILCDSVNKINDSFAENNRMYAELINRLGAMPNYAQMASLIEDTNKIDVIVKDLEKFKEENKQFKEKIDYLTVHVVFIAGFIACSWTYKWIKRIYERPRQERSSK